MPTPLLSTIQSAIKTRLESESYLTGVGIVTESKGDIVQMVSAELLKTGVGVLVLTPAAFANRVNVPGPYFYTEAGGVKIRVQVYENVAINQSNQGSQKPAATIAETILASLHLHTPTGLAVITIDPGAPSMVSDYADGILIYDINLMTHGGLTLE